MTALCLAHLSGPLAADITSTLYPQTVAMEGRSVQIAAHEAAGSIQWQVLARGTSTWTNLRDDAGHGGTATSVLEIYGVKAELGGTSYRFSLTLGGVTTFSNATTLVVSPLLFPAPIGLGFDRSTGHLYVTDASTHAVRRISDVDFYGWGNLTDLRGERLLCAVTNVAGASGQAGFADGTGAQARFNLPHGILHLVPGSVSEAGLVVVDSANGTIRRIDAAGVVSTLAGSSRLRGNVDGPGAAARFSAPMGVALAADGSYLVADSSSHTIRRVSADGTVSTLAGSPGQAGAVDGIGLGARFHNPTGIAVRADGTVFVADTTNNLIRKIAPGGEVTTLAGLAGVAGARDGTGVEALFNGPTGLAAAGTGVFVADTGNSTIRLVSDSGLVSTYAGTPGVAGHLDSVAGTYSPSQPGYRFPSMFNKPQALAWSDEGLLFIADTGNSAIRVISQYDGWTLTLPLAELPAPLVLPARTASTPASAPAAPQPGATAPNGATAGGGGGAPSGWFFLTLAGASLLRRLRMRPV